MPPRRSSTEAPASAAFDLSQPFKVAKEEVIADFEQRYLRALLEQAGGNISRAARLAKMDRMYLYRLLQRYELRGGSIKD
jgi:DNA-binding NtrC family response regulator